MKMDPFEVIKQDWRDICKRNEGDKIPYCYSDQEYYYDDLYKKFAKAYLEYRANDRIETK